MMNHLPPFALTRARRRAGRALRACAIGAVLCGAALFVAGCGERAAPPGGGAGPVLSAAFKANSGFVVPVTIAGKVYDFLVDTGTSFTVIDNRVAESITQTMRAEDVPVMFRTILGKGLSTPNGVLAQEQVRLWQSLSLGLGTYEVPNRYPWIGLDLSLASQAAGRQIDGMIGMELFRQLNWVADNRSGQLTVWRQPPSGEHFAHCVPYQDSFGLSPAITLNFGDGWASFRFDTGARYSNVTDAALAHFVEHQAATPLGGAGRTATVNGVGESRDHLVNGLSFDDHLIGRLRVSEGAENVLGLNFLERFDRYMFVPSTMELCYDASHFKKDEPAPLRQLAIRALDGRVEVFQNAPDELGRYGLENGDVLIEINGKRVAASAIADVRDQLIAAPVGSLHVTIERAGTRHTVAM